MRFSVIYTFFITATLFLSSLFLSGCSDKSELRASEDETILKWLTSRNYTEEDYWVTDGVYRIIAGNAFDNSEEPYDPPTINTGDKVGFLYTLFVFTGSEQRYTNKENLDKESIIYTNDRELVSDKINPEYWPDGPLEIISGNGEVIKGIDVSLPGCRLGDLVILVIPSEMAYGKAEIGVVGSDKIIYCIIDITGVNDETIPGYGPEDPQE